MAEERSYAHRTRIQKLGVKEGQRVLLVRLKDPELRKELDAQGAIMTTRPAPGMDAIFVAMNERAELPYLAALKAHLKPNGAIWVIRPKGTPAISEADVMRGGKEAGLVDVKVVRYSDTHTAEKFVIPVSHRR